jgi:hypothetical protein
MGLLVHLLRLGQGIYPEPGQQYGHCEVGSRTVLTGHQQLMGIPYALVGEHHSIRSPKSPYRLSPEAITNSNESRHERNKGDQKSRIARW